MSKAEDFEKTLPISSRGQAGLNRYEFAEAYHQSEFKKRVNNINNDEIDRMVADYTNRYDYEHQLSIKYFISFYRQGILDFKNKLLKQ